MMVVGFFLEILHTELYKNCGSKVLRFSKSLSFLDWDETSNTKVVFPILISPVYHNLIPLHTVILSALQGLA